MLVKISLSIRTLAGMIAALLEVILQVKNSKTVLLK
jgi:hypothetical protein